MRLISKQREIERKSRVITPVACDHESRSEIMHVYASALEIHDSTTTRSWIEWDRIEWILFVETHKYPSCRASVRHLLIGDLDDRTHHLFIHQFYNNFEFVVNAENIKWYDYLKTVMDSLWILKKCLVLLLHKWEFLRPKN